jgi:hypothetical protein
LAALLIREAVMGLGLLARLALGVVLLVVIASSGCGHDQRLIQIAVTPSNETVSTAPGVSLEIQYTAIGTFEHPPEQKDITKLVVWSTPTKDIVSIDAATGLATTHDGCGTNVPILATGHQSVNSGTGGVVVGTATVSLTHPGVC